MLGARRCWSVAMLGARCRQSSRERDSDDPMVGGRLEGGVVWCTGKDALLI
uniref:Uncharacterized protein n=1 Tax=Triticum urartu TaxID=4572 RepID=A0A8R7TJ00_TRIUA